MNDPLDDVVSAQEPEREPHRPVPSPRQTLSYLRNLFTQYGLRPKSKLGQNFLIDLNLVDLMARVGGLTRDDLALEVGTGTGSLTTRLADHAGAVVTVEIDPAFASLAQETLADRPNVTVIHADILASKNTLNPDVLAQLEDIRQRGGYQQIKLVANLPYAVATPVLSNLLLTELPIERMVGMVQWEIAERLTARPSNKDYGALAVLMQSLADVEIVRRLPPKVFFPRPDVWSGIVRIFPNAAKRAKVGDVVRFRAFLRDLYTHRRKNLRGALLGFHGHPLQKTEIDARLAELGLETTVRAEDLDLEEHRRLCEVFGSAVEKR